MIIDIHGHIAHPSLLARYPMPPSLGDVDAMIEAKAAAGIGLTIVGSPAGAATMVPVPGLDTYRQPADQLRAFHDWLATVARERREHLRAYAWCNAFADDSGLAEAAETVRADGFVGIIANTSIEGEYLDSPRAGRLEQHPGVRIIGASSGGALALLGKRLDLAWQPRHWDEAPGKSSHAARNSAMPNTAPRCTAPPSELMQRLYVDTTADGVTPIAMDLGVFGAGHVLFGTDSPPLPVALEAAVEAFGFLNAEDRDSILGGNATRIFALS